MQCCCYLILNIFTNTKNAFANFTEVYLQSVHSVSSTHSDTIQYGIHKIEQEHFAWEQACHVWLRTTVKNVTPVFRLIYNLTHPFKCSSSLFEICYVLRWYIYKETFTWLLLIRNSHDQWGHLMWCNTKNSIMCDVMICIVWMIWMIWGHPIWCRMINSIMVWRDDLTEAVTATACD